MKITIISYDNWGLNNHLATNLKNMGHNVHHVNFSNFTYKYPTKFHRYFNFILKTFFKKNLKNIHYGKEIIKILKENREIQDVILTIKADFIDPKSTLAFKKYTKKSIAFFNDSTTRCPKIIPVLPNLDEVYSFEKEDCEKYNLKFTTNWIYDTNSEWTPVIGKKFKYQVFNISSIDKRLPILTKIAAQLFEKKIAYKFIIFDKKEKNKNSDKSIDFVSQHIPLSEVNKYIHDAKVLLDINRKGQKGLTFRVFESLGLEKKLITTNSDIQNYDFYNPNNILIIDEKNPHIPLSFFNNEYQKIPESILEKYTIDGWIKKIILQS